MNLQIYKILTLPSVILAVLRMGYHNIGPLSVNQPVLRMGYPNLALLSVNPVIFTDGQDDCCGKSSFSMPISSFKRRLIC